MSDYGYDLDEDYASELIELKVNNTSRSIYWIKLLGSKEFEDGFDMDQPYQRGVVWGVKRQRNLIRSILSGVPVPALIINDRGLADFDDYSGAEEARNIAYAVVDGKQRITSILRWVQDDLAVPAKWFHAQDITEQCEEAWHLGGLVHYSGPTRPAQRKFENRPIAVAEGRLTTLRQEQEVFTLLNFGGLAQGEVDSDA